MNPDQNPQNIKNPLETMQPGEQVICEIKRHPIGLIGTYVSGMFFILLAAVLAFVFAPRFVTGGTRGQALGIATVAFVCIAVIVALFMFISSKIYKGNRWIVTSDSVTQISQTGLFSTQSSQLSMGNIEDVTAEQNGFMPQMLGYGLLRVETAGERSKFAFMFCPKPNYYAQQILNAREAFEQGRHGEGEQRLYREQGAYAQPMPQVPQAPPTGDNQNQPPQAPPSQG